MRNLSPHHITSTQLMFILTGSQVGTTMLSLPMLVCKETDQHGWMAVLLGAIIPLTSIFFIERLGRRLPGHNFVQVNQALLGKIGGTLGVIVFVLYVVLFNMLLMNGFARLINIYLLPQTPLWATELLAMVCVVYAGSKGGTVVGRLNETLFFGILISLFFILIPAYYSSDYTNLLPLGELELGRLFRATLVTSYAYAGTEVLLVFYSQVSDPQRVMRAGLAATAITTVIYLIVTIACIMVFGSDGVVKYVWPGVTILKVANIAVVERLEFYFLAIWVGIVLRRVINRSFAAALSMAQLFRVEDRYGLAILGVGICSYIAALQIPNLAASRELISYAVWAYFFMGIIYPLLLLSISWIREGVVKQNA